MTETEHSPSPQTKARGIAPVENQDIGEKE